MLSLLLHVVCGVAVEPQRVVVDEHGNFVAPAISGWSAPRPAEYDGADHLTRVGQRRDLARGRRVAGVEWVRRGYTSVECSQGVAILRDADLAVGRAHRPERIRRHDCCGVALHGRRRRVSEPDWASSAHNCWVATRNRARDLSQPTS